MDPPLKPDNAGIVTSISYFSSKCSLPSRANTFPMATSLSNLRSALIGIPTAAGRRISVECKESRIGIQNVTVAMDGQDLKVKGPLHLRELQVLLHREDSGLLRVRKATHTRRANQMHGLFNFSYRQRCIPRFSYSSFSSSTSSPVTKFGCNIPITIPDAYKDGGNHLGESDGGNENGDIEIEIQETGNNSRRIQSKVSVDATLQTVWNILTDYEKLADFIPGLAVSQLLYKTEKFARIFQIGQQNLAFGLKFKAQGVIDCYERDIQNLPLGQRRDIEFEMIEGDFQLFQGKWSVEQISNKGEYELANSIIGQDFHTTLSYVVDVEPQVWLPVRLVQGRLCREIKTNLLCIKIAAERAFENKVSANE